MSVERWTDESLDRLASLVASNAEANAIAFAEIANLIESNERAAESKAKALAVNSYRMTERSSVYE